MAQIEPIIDPSDFPIDQIVWDTDAIEAHNPHRFEFRLLDSVLHLDSDSKILVAHRHIPEDDFWVRGHIPGRPIMPGVLLLEALGQAASIHVHMDYHLEEGRFMGFCGLENARFRGSLKPGTDIWIAGKMLRYSESRAYLKWQGQILIADGTVICDGTVIGMGI